MSKISTFLKNHYKEIFYILMSVFWICFYIYTRILVERQPYLLSDITPNWKYLCFQISFLLLHIFIISTIVYNTYINKNMITGANIIIDKFNSLLNTIFYNPLTYMRDLVSPYFLGTGAFYIKCISFIDKYDIDPSKLLTIIFYILPRIVVASVFFVEIIFWQKIDYFITSLFLLIFPILWRIFVNLFTDFGKNGLRDIQQYIHIKPTGHMFANGWCSSYSFETKTCYIYTEESLKEYIDGWRNCMLIYGYGESFLNRYLKIVSPLVSITCSSLYAMGILTKLIYIIN